MKCLKSAKDQFYRDDEETLSVLLMQAIFPLFRTNCTMMWILLSELRLGLPNSFHLLDLGLTGSQTSKSDKSE